MDAGTGLIDCRSFQSYWNNTLVFEFFSFHFSKTVQIFILEFTKDGGKEWYDPF